MGVEKTEYVIIGINVLELVKEDDGELDGPMAYLEETAEKHGLKFIYDGMSGEYAILGKVISEHSEEDEVPPTVIDSTALKQKEITLILDLHKYFTKEEFQEYLTKASDKTIQLGLHVFTHYH